MKQFESGVKGVDYGLIHIDTEARFPDCPIEFEFVDYRIFHIDDVLSADFFPIIHDLRQASRSRAFYIKDVSPFSDLLAKKTGYRAEWVFHSDDPSSLYGDVVHEDPVADIEMTLQNNAESLIVAGASGDWAIWCQRDWELALLCTKFHIAPGRFIPPAIRDETPLSEVRSPVGWGLGIEHDVLEGMRRAVTSRVANAGRASQ